MILSQIIANFYFLIDFYFRMEFFNSLPSGRNKIIFVACNT